MVELSMVMVEHLPGENVPARTWLTSMLCGRKCIGETEIEHASMIDEALSRFKAPPAQGSLETVFDAKRSCVVLRVVFETQEA